MGGIHLTECIKPSNEYIITYIRMYICVSSYVSFLFLSEINIQVYANVSEGHESGCENPVLTLGNRVNEF